ncbi:MAG: hypothetical protein ACOCQQ_00405 [Candidatus Nanoarchaeia archaeon]
MDNDNLPFRAYDIRGIYNKDITPEFAKHLGNAFVRFLDAKYLVVGKDARKGSHELADALIQGIRDAGATAVVLGDVSTPQFYFSLFYEYVFDGGIMITASHNPKEYNGFKLCGRNAQPIFFENGLEQIKSLLLSYTLLADNKKGGLEHQSIHQEYLSFMSSNHKQLSRSFHILADTSNGMGIYEITTLQKILGANSKITIFNETIDGSFPAHEPNPTLSNVLTPLCLQVKKTQGVDFGIAFDGDADRIVFVTRDGTVVSPDIITGIVALQVASRGDLVGVDMRTSPGVVDELTKKGIVVKRTISGNPFLKKTLYEQEGIFGGERSAHYVFSSLHYTDSSLLTLLNVMRYLDTHNLSLEDACAPFLAKWTSLPEKNFSVQQPEQTLFMLEEFIQEQYNDCEDFLLTKEDGLTLQTSTIFVNIRKSNTEPLLRLTIHATSQEVACELDEIFSLFLNKH